MGFLFRERRAATETERFEYVIDANHVIKEVKHLYRTLLERVKETPGTDTGSRGLPECPLG